LYDAIVATRDAQATFQRRPTAVDHAITAIAGIDPDRSSYPSEHAAVAAAATVLA
jgi:hypothetical protein